MSGSSEVSLPPDVSTPEPPEDVNSFAHGADVELPPSCHSVDAASCSKCTLSLPGDASTPTSLPEDCYDDPMDPDDDVDNSLWTGNGFDESVEVFDDAVELPDDILEEEEEAGDGPADSVPSPAVAEHLSMHQDIAEFYSMPRVLPSARSRGFRGTLSLDLNNGWDFKIPKLCDLSCRLLLILQITMLILSPPCTAFSFLQELFNYKKLPVAVVQQKIAAAMILLRHALQCAMIQYKAGRLFVFEHPASATSWKLPEVRSMLDLPGMYSVVFDQCMLGLKSKVHQIPMRKRTRFMTNSLGMAAAFRGCLCNRQHEHQVIQGCEGGVDRSVWAQRYPAPMVELLVAASAADMSAH